MPVRMAGHFFQCLFSNSGFVHKGRAAFEIAPPGCRHFHSPCVTVKQAHTQLLLHTRDTTRERGPRHSEAKAGAVKAARARHLDKERHIVQDREILHNNYYSTKYGIENASLLAA